MSSKNSNHSGNGYKGKYYDPNYKQNKAKYGNAYDPKDFAVPNPNYNPRTSNNRNRVSNNKDSYRKRKNSNYKGRNFHPKYHTYTPEQKRAIRSKRNIQRLTSIIILMLVALFVQFGSNFDLSFLDILDSNNSSQNENTSTNVDNTADTSAVDSVISLDVSSLLSNTEIAIDSCDLSGTRQANVKANIGYGNRNYYGYTNEYAQLVYIQADNLQLQNSSTEPLVDGRYCEAQANVDGASGSYNRGHGIGDALGGDSNAYNIFPQLSSVNGWFI